MKAVVIALLIYLAVSQSFLSEPEEILLNASNGAGSTIASCARSKVGCSYVWGKAGPNQFDCSGLAKYCYAQVGINLPHHSGSQANMGYKVSDPQEGDLVFFDFGSGVSHVAISIGGGQIVHARNERVGVTKDSITSGYWHGVSHFAKRLY